MKTNFNLEKKIVTSYYKSMIAKLTGILAEKNTDSVIVEVGGVGYQVIVSQTGIRSLPAEGSKVQFYIHTHVREDQLTLFGFLDKTEKDIFLRLMGVSGIGPKLAISVLSGLQPHDLVQAVIREDIARINSIQGVGKKTAERIILDLKDKFIKEFAGTGSRAPSHKPLYNDALSALINLGYPRISIEKALCKTDFEGTITLQTVIRSALKELGQSRT